MRREGRVALRVLVRLLGSALVLGGVVWGVGLDALFEVQTRVDLGWLASLLVMVVANAWLDAYRFGLLWPSETRPALGLLLRARLEAAFAGLFLPGTLGSDAYLTVVLRRVSAGSAPALAKVLLNRFVGLLAFLPLASAAVVVRPELRAVREVSFGLVIFALCCGVALGLLLYFPSMGPAGGAEPTGVRAWLGATVLALRQAGADRLALAQATLAATLYNASTVTMAWMCLRAVGGSVDASAFAAVFPFTVIAALLPLGYAGFGTQEAAYAFFLASLGEPPEVAVAASLAWNVLKVLLAAVGGGLLVWRRGDTGSAGEG